MEAQLIDSVVCPKCHASLPPAADACFQCGAATLSERRSVSTAAPTTPVVPLLDRPWFILGFLFLAAMILGVPVLWRSKAFNTRMKIILTILVTIYTIVIFWGFGLIMLRCYHSIRESLGMMQQPAI